MDRTFDAIVVGAGPGGSAAAYHLARRGHRVALVDKAKFPRDKVCGDGLTPRAVRAIERMGIPTDGPEWARAHGLRIIGGGVTLELPWPVVSDLPGYALVRTRHDFDDILLDAARKAGAEVLEETDVTGPLLDDRGVVTGVTIGHNGDRAELRAPVVIASDGASSRFSLALGGRRLEDRPMGVAVRAYYRSPRSMDDYLESYLELWRGEDLLPGYGWIFPLPDGTVNVGLGLLNSSKHFQNVDYKRLLGDWVSALPAEWDLTPETRIGKVRGGPLPMGFNRAPVARPGLMLVGDAAGIVNPFNGEGISCAMESAEIAAGVAHDALAAGGDPYALRAYPERLHAEYEGYYIMGRAFVKLIGQAPIMNFLTRYGMPRRALMEFAFKILAHMTEPNGGHWQDRLIGALERAAPTINKVVRV